MTRKRKQKKALARAKAFALVVPVTQRTFVPYPTRATAWETWGSAL